VVVVVVVGGGAGLGSLSAGGCCCSFWCCCCGGGCSAADARIFTCVCGLFALYRNNFLLLVIVLFFFVLRGIFGILGSRTLGGSRTLKVLVTSKRKNFCLIKTTMDM